MIDCGMICPYPTTTMTSACSARKLFDHFGPADPLRLIHRQVRSRSGVSFTGENGELLPASLRPVRLRVHRDALRARLRRAARSVGTANAGVPMKTNRTAAISSTRRLWPACGSCA